MTVPIEDRIYEMVWVGGDIPTNSLQIGRSAMGSHAPQRLGG